MKQVLAIMGSPRKKGDTYRLVSAIEDRLTEKGDVEFRYIHLRECNLENCRGCLLCMKRGEEACPIKDGAAGLRRELLAADGIIFASPVYVHQVTALMKNFFDRFAFFMHRPAFHGRPALLVTSTEISGAGETLAYLRFCAEAWGLVPVGEIGVIADGMKMECLYRERTMKRIETSAREFSAALERRLLPSPPVRSLQFFRKLHTKVIIHREKLPYDFQYWGKMGWLAMDYFYPARIGFVKKALAAAPVIFIVLAMKLRLGSAMFRSLFLEPMQSYRRECRHERG